MEVAKALGGSFKLVTLAPKTVREMTQLPRETQKNSREAGQRNPLSTFHLLDAYGVDTCAFATLVGTIMQWTEATEYYCGPLDYR